MSEFTADKINLTVFDKDNQRHQLTVGFGVRLRDALIQNGLSPYGGAIKSLNCKGMGICGTCKVIVREHGADWEKRSCQIQCFHQLEIRLK